MKPRVCICCGEPMTAAGNDLSRNPNVCASCSSMVDGMDELPMVEELTPEDRCPPDTDERAAKELAADDPAVAGRWSGPDLAA